LRILVNLNPREGLIGGGADSGISKRRESGKCNCGRKSGDEYYFHRYKHSDGRVVKESQREISGRKKRWVPGTKR